MTPTVSTAVGAIAGIGTACVAYGTFVERRWYRLRHVSLQGALRRPATAGPLRVLHLSDLHVQPDDRRLRDFLVEVAQLDVDLVALTGDLLGHEGVEDHAVDLLRPVFASGVPGVLVLGSNDVFAPTLKSPHHYFVDPDHREHGDRLDTDRMLAGLTGLGVRTLRGDTTTLATRQGEVVVGGLDDPHLAETVLPDVDAIAAPDPSDAILHLGLAHAPYRVALDLLAEAGHDLLLAGHTHGGQVRFPPIGALIGNCDLPLDQVRGESRYQPASGGPARWLHVSPGLGTSPFAPFRFACRPEATVLHLT